MFFKLAITEIEGLDDFLMVAPALAGDSPILGGQIDLGARVGNQRLLHLPDHRISQNHGRNAVAIGKIESQHGMIVHLLHAVRRQHDQAIAAVSAAFNRLEIIGLRRIDSAKPRA